MKFFRNQKILFSAVTLGLALTIFYTFRVELITLYNEYKYSVQVNDAKRYLKTVAKKNSRHETKFFTKDSNFLSSPIYLEQLQEYLIGKDIKSFRPVHVYKLSENNREVLFIRLVNSDDYPVNFKFIKPSNKWLISFLHLDP